MKKFLTMVAVAMTCLMGSSAFADSVDWCNFQWMEADSHIGYGRILLPEGKTASDVSAYMACTTDLSKPVVEWNKIDAVHNPFCQDCGKNVEFMTESAYAGYQGTNYCTFVFKLGKDDVMACRPVKDGQSDPMRMDSKRKLVSDMTRTFAPDKCGEGDKGRCAKNEVQACVDGYWQHYETCKAGQKCDASVPACK